jgi:hypothetical protein
VVDKNTVSIRVTYECGRCANRVVRTVKTTADGLIEMTPCYCGRCVKGTRLSQMSVTLSEGKIVEPPEPEPKITGVLNPTKKVETDEKKPVEKTSGEKQNVGSVQ